MSQFSNVLTQLDSWVTCEKWLGKLYWFYTDQIPYIHRYTLDFATFVINNWRSH